MEAVPSTTKWQGCYGQVIGINSMSSFVKWSHIICPIHFKKCSWVSSYETHMKKNLKCMRCFGISDTHPLLIPLIRWSTQWVFPPSEMRAQLGGAWCHHGVVGEKPTKPSWGIIAADRIEFKQHSWAPLNTTVEKENALHRNSGALEDASIRAHPSVSLTMIRETW